MCLCNIHVISKLQFVWFSIPGRKKYSRFFIDYLDQKTIKKSEIILFCRKIIDKYQIKTAG